MTEPPPPTVRTRALYVALGVVGVILGVVGALLPIIPATPFFLVALWAFERSSPRLHDWLWHHRWFGPGLQRWRRERTIPLWVKIFAIGAMLTSATYTTVALRPTLPWLVALYAFIAAGMFVVARIPTRRRPTALRGEPDDPYEPDGNS